MATQQPENAKKPDPNDAYGPPDEDDAADVAEPPPQKPVKKQEHLIPSPALRRAAKAFGFTDDQIDEASPDALEEAVAAIAEDRERTRRQPEPPAKPAKAAEDEDDDDTLESLDKRLQLDPDLKKILKKQISGRKQATKEAAELKAALAERDQRDQRRTIRAGEDAVENAIANLGEEYVPILGEGSLSSLKKDSEESDARKAIFAAAAIDLANDSPATIQRKYEKAAKRLFGKFVTKAKSKEEEEEEAASEYETPKKPVKKKAGPDLGADGHSEIDWEEAGTARPTQRKIVAKKGDKAAVENVRRYYQEMGIPGGSGSGNKNDTFNGVPE